MQESVTDNDRDLIHHGKPGVVVYYIHKFEVCQRYGGPEEGGWYYEEGTPCEDWVPLRVAVVDGHLDENETVFDYCRMFNHGEHERREGLRYGFHSVLSHREEFYSYDISTSSIPQAYPKFKPHYE